MPYIFAMKNDEDLQTLHYGSQQKEEKRITQVSGDGDGARASCYSLYNSSKMGSIAIYQIHPIFLNIKY